MQEQLSKRVAELETEYRAGQKMLADLEARHAEVQQTLLRIEGALQVLKELLGADRAFPGADADAAREAVRPSAPGTPPPDADSVTPSAELVAG